MKNYFSYILIISLFVVGKVSAQDYANLLKNNLLSLRSSNGMTQHDIEGLVVYNQSTNKRSGVEHVYAVQSHNGIEIFNANIAAAFRGEDLIYTGDNLQRGIGARIRNTSLILTPVQAATSAASFLGAGIADFKILETVSSQEVFLDNGNVSLNDVPVKLVYQLTEDNMFRLAWDLNIHMINEPHWYSLRIDAENGNILNKVDWMVSCNFDSHSGNASSITSHNSKTSFGFDKEITNQALAGEQYNVFPLPLESPNEGINQIVVAPQDIDASPFGWHDTDGIEGAEFTITRGNNVFAFDDLDASNGIGQSPDGGNDLLFDFDYSLEIAEPIDMLDASTTNLFYLNNVNHDIMYHYGFDEESGNFQETNYSGVGFEQDFVNAQAQDSGGLNNATFGTPPDGTSPVMQMLLWSPPDVTAFFAIDEGSLIGTYTGIPADFGGSFPLEMETRFFEMLTLIEDDPSGSSDTLDACDVLIDVASLEGNIGIVRRGTCEFSHKILAAETNGAVAVIVVNNEPGPPVVMGEGELGSQVTIPSFMIGMSDGEALIAGLQGGEDIEGSIYINETFHVDGSLDNAIVTHEYGHGISARLTGGASNADCLTNNESMSEGWSDYFGLMVTMKTDDFAEQARPFGTYAVSEPSTGAGIRVMPYSTDFSINDLTYADTNDEVEISSPHGIGTVWATILWDMTWFLIDQYGFDADLYNGNGGNNIALQLVMDGLKLQPCSPAFVNGRDAVIAAIEINTMIPEDDKAAITCGIWGVFANRGLGVNAEQGSRFIRTDQVENFDTPDLTDPSSICFDPLATDEFVKSNFSVYPNPSNGQINLNMRTSLGEGQIQIMDLNGRVVFTQDNLLEGVLSIDASELATGVYLLKISNQTLSETKKLIIK